VNSDELVRSLVADLAPVRRLRSADSRFARWAALAVACVVSGAYALGARSDLAVKLTEPGYLAEAVVLLLVFASSARSAFLLGIPGREPSLPARLLPVAGLVGWLALIASRGLPGVPLPGVATWSAGVACVARMLVLGFVPGIAILRMLREAAPREHGWMGRFAVLAVSAIAIVGTQAVCSKDDPGHVVLWHVGPVLMSALVGAGPSRLLLGSTSRPPRA
jgi:hypothetical protein